MDLTNDEERKKNAAQRRGETIKIVSEVLDSCAAANRTHTPVLIGASLHSA